MGDVPARPGGHEVPEPGVHRSGAGGSGVDRTVQAEHAPPREQEHMTAETLVQALDDLADEPACGLRAYRLLVEGRQLAGRFMERPGIGADELRAYIKRVDELLEEFGR